jgi:DNA-binding transcriptional regulator YhcF (GntR family)
MAADIRLDRSSEVPLGVQLAWHLRALMASGELEAGARLPSVREMAAQTGVNANTVRAVYARLEAEGLIATQHGRGSFVTGGDAGGRLAEIARRAADEARAAGVDPRAVAAALFVTGEEARAPSPDAVRRRALREEIAALERRLGDARHARRLAAHAEDPLAAPPPRPPSGRLLGAAELEALRDELAARLALLEDADDAERERGTAPAAAPAAQHSTRPRDHVTLAPSAPRWRLGH